MEISNLLSLLQNYSTSGLSSSSSTSDTSDSSEAGGSLASSLFAALDTDNSTGLTLDEYSAVQSAMESLTSSSGAESSGDAPPELTDDQLTELFNSADTDGNGELSEDEFTALDEKMRAGGPGGAGGPPPGGPPPSGGSDDDDDTSTDTVTSTSSTSNSSNISDIIEQILAQLAEQIDEDSDSTASNSDGSTLADRLQAMLSNSTYGKNGGEEYGMETTSGALMNCLA